jgi:hypothetical protein
MFNDATPEMAELAAELQPEVGLEMAELAGEPLEIDVEMADLDREVETIGQALLANMEQLIAQQQQQIQMFAALSRQIQMAMLAPRRIVRDNKGRVVGSEVAV